MQEIFNEGRVVGMSAYEAYVRHHMEEYGDDPNNPPASEHGWLASTITLGTSLLLEISPDGNYVKTGSWANPDGSSGNYWGIEIKVPKKAALCAANVILGNLFIGEAELDESNPPFCKKVTDYGFLSSDTHKANYQNLIMNPSQIDYYDQQIQEYSKLVDGVVIQPSKDPDGWSDYVPDLTDSPKIRLLFREKVKYKFLMLLSGFSDTSVISGLVGISGISQAAYPERGDFLGPDVFPWSTKILIQVPNATISRLLSNKFTRRLTEVSTVNYSGVKGGSSPTAINADCVVDLTHAHLEKYHDQSSSMIKTAAARLQEIVDRFTPLAEKVNQFAVVSRDEGLYDVPAIFARSIAGTGTQFLYPLDVAAPGTVKGYPELAMTSDAEMLKFFENRPGCYAFVMRDDYTLYRIRKNGNNIERVPVADHFNGTYGLENGITGKVGKYLKIQTGDKVKYANNTPSISGIKAKAEDDGAQSGNTMKAGTGDYVGGTALSRMAVNTGDVATNFVSLRTISYAYDSNLRLDLLGNPLRKFRNNLVQNASDQTKLDCYVAINFKQPMIFDQTATFNNNVTFNSPITVNSTADFEQDVTMKKNLDLYGHLRLKKHRYRNTDVASCGTASASQDREGHIDLIGDPGADIHKFGLGVNAQSAGYITFPAASGGNLRLYISRIEPTGDIPDGSIGIGW